MAIYWQDNVRPPELEGISDEGAENIMNTPSNRLSDDKVRIKGIILARVDWQAILEAEPLRESVFLGTIDEGAKFHPLASDKADLVFDVPPAWLSEPRCSYYLAKIKVNGFGDPVGELLSIKAAGNNLGEVLRASLS